MANVSTMTYWNPALEVADSYELCISFARNTLDGGAWENAAAMKLTPVPINNATLTVVTPAIRTDRPVTQEQINQHLGTVDEFDAEVFKGLGYSNRDAMGFIINCGGQCREVVGAQLLVVDDDGVGGGAQSKPYRIDQLTLGGNGQKNEIAVGRFGNIAVTTYHQSMSTIKTPGQLSLRIFWRSK